MISWEFFQKRRNIDLSVWIIEFNIEDYEQLKLLCATKNVEPPPYATFQAAQASVLSKVTQTSGEIEKAKPTEKKPVRQRKRRTTKKRTSK